VPALGDAQNGAGAVQALTQRRGPALRQPGIAFGPGEDGFAIVAFGFALCLITRRVETMAAGEVVQPGPGGDPGRRGAVVVAAAVVEVPAKVRVIEAPLIQPLREGLCVQRSLQRAPGAAVRGLCEGGAATFAVRAQSRCTCATACANACICRALAEPGSAGGSRPSTHTPSKNKRCCGL